MLPEGEVRMDTETLEASSALQYQCPHCGALETDDFEWLSEDTTYPLTCDGCRGSFFLTVHECQACGADVIDTSRDAPSADKLRRLTCACCGHAVVEEDEDEPLFQL